MSTRIAATEIYPSPLNVFADQWPRGDTWYVIYGDAAATHMIAHYRESMARNRNAANKDYWDGVECVCDNIEAYMQGVRSSESWTRHHVPEVSMPAFEFPAPATEGGGE